MKVQPVPAGVSNGPCGLDQLWVTKEACKHEEGRWDSLGVLTSKPPVDEGVGIPELLVLNKEGLLPLQR
jgi:hypothetical protein